MQPIGLIGVGNIGRYYTSTLLAAGYQLSVVDIDPQHAQFAYDLGAQVCITPAELAQQADIILLSLPGSPQVEAVMERPGGLLAGLHAGQLIIDTGTSRPETDIRYHCCCDALGVGYLDAPITWRSQGLTIMVGGEAADFERGREVLTCLSYKLRHVGSIGSGQVLKLANQMILAGQMAVWSEAIEFTRQGGLDPHLLSEYLDFPITPGLEGDNYEGGGQLALHYKDLIYALDYAHETSANVPLTAQVHEIFKAAKIYGEPNWLQTGIVTYWRRLNNKQND
jgi:3-hydroxyisobutyrate dehydrogenase-like beta-hydroxyacid dehydrogenase